MNYPQSNFHAHRLRKCCRGLLHLKWPHLSAWEIAVNVIYMKELSLWLAYLKITALCTEKEAKLVLCFGHTLFLNGMFPPKQYKN